MGDNKWTYFAPKEVEGLDTEFVAKLDMARHRSGIPYVITSGFRDPAHNAEVGGVTDSAHTKGLAVDLLCRDSSHLFKIIDGLLSVGLNRIGIYFVSQADGFQPFHVHVDMDKTKPANVVFLKQEKLAVV